MTGHRCIVFGCNDRPRKSGKSVAYHMFPTNKFLREIWIKRCGRHEQFNADRSYICSAHFKEDDYEKNPRVQSSWTKKFILKPTAIPTLNLGSWSLKTSKTQSSSHDGSRNKEIRVSPSSSNQSRNIEELFINDNYVGIKEESGSSNKEITTSGCSGQDIKIEEVDMDDENFPLLDFKEESNIEIEEPNVDHNNYEEDPDIIFVNEIKVSKLRNEEIEDCQIKIEDHQMEEVSADEFKVFVSDCIEIDASEEVYVRDDSSEADKGSSNDKNEPANPLSKMKYHTLVHSHNRLLQRVKELQNELILSQSLVAKLKEKVTSLECELHEAREQTVEDLQLKEGIGDVLSKSQINFGILKKKNIFWTSEDISKAFTIRYFSSRCYMYLRDTLKYPLPGISSLQRWVSKINMQQGILHGILRIMKIAGYAMTDFEKTVVLHFDEIKVRSLYEYDEIQDEVLGPYSTMQIIMARGLFSDWKQPIYIGFDKRITKMILLDVIEKLHDATYNVVACVSDCSKTNEQLWNELEITTDRTHIVHSITNNRIYFFVDSSHLLVLIYKSLIETGFTLEDGTVVTKEPLEQLIVSKTKFNLSPKHLQLKEEQRQNVELAGEIFSRECVTVLKNSDSKLALHAGIFIEQICSWFELTKTYMPSSNLLMKKLYGGDLERQNDVLDSISNMIKTLSCTSKNNMEMFQEGMLISMKSLKQLFNDMWIKYSIKHILTYRLNLDSLEDLLSQVRVSDDNHPLPSPLTMVYKIRTLVLGNCVNQNSSKEVLKNEYILSKVLTANISIYNPELKAIKEGDLNMLLSFTEADHLKYLAALSATKFKDKYPTLVDETDKKRNYVLPFWLQHLSCGDLTKASKYWLTQIKHMDKMFTFHHGKDGVLKRNRKKNVIKKLVNYVTKRFKNVFPLEVITEFVKQRTLVRIMHCNIKLTSKARRKKRKNVKVEISKNI